MKAIITALLLSVSASAWAGFKSGNELLNDLDNNSETLIHKAMATGYIIGVHDATEGALHCSPMGITVGQIRDMVHQWLRANPADRHHPANAIVVHVLRSTWPCKQSPSSSL